MIDPEIIKRCQQKDQTAYDALFKTAGKKALWTAYLLTGRMEIAEEIVQESFFRCFCNIKNLHKPEMFTVWFNRILVRTCWYVIRKERKTPEVSLEDEKLPELKDHDNGDILEKVEQNQVSMAIRKTVNSLKPALRSTIVLFYYNELTIREIAKVMGCLQGTVKSRLHYAKKVLEKELKRELLDEHIHLSGYTGYTGKECVENE